jgi:hypothetical protein
MTYDLLPMRKLLHVGLKMMKTRLGINILALVAVFCTNGALAQGIGTGGPPLQAKTLDQYPSFIEITGTANGVSPGSGFDLRCGLDYINGQIVFNGYTDITFVNVATNAYARHQFIDGKVVVSVFAPASNNQRMLIEVIEPDHSVRAKNCQVDLQSDLLQNCQAAPGFMSYEQASAWPSVTVQTCQLALAKNGPAMNKTLPNQQEIMMFYQQLAHRLAVLEN